MGPFRMETIKIQVKPVLPLPQFAGIWLVSGLAVVILALIYTRSMGLPAAAVSHNEVVRLIQGGVFAAAGLFALSLLGASFRSIYSGFGAHSKTSLKLAAKYFFVYLLVAAVLVGALSLAAMLLMKLGVFSLDAFNEYHARATVEKLAQKNYIRDVLIGSPGRFLIYIFSTCILVPIGEEIFNRRLLYVFLRRRFGIAISLTISSLIFGLAHFGAAAVPAAIFGLLLGWAYEKHQDLSANIMLHGMINFTVTLITVYLSM